jgi:plastocyanin
MTIRRLMARALSVTLLVTLGSCSNQSAPSEPPVQSTTITITSAGVSPKNVLVSLGQRVLFVNNDGRSHNMTSDPHPDHGDCPELNQVGFLSAGQSRETGNLVVARTCGFHDHDIPGSTSLQGSITIR